MTVVIMLKVRIDDNDAQPLQIQPLLLHCIWAVAFDQRLHQVLLKPLAAFFCSLRSSKLSQLPAKYLNAWSNKNDDD